MEISTLFFSVRFGPGGMIYLQPSILPANGEGTRINYVDFIVIHQNKCVNMCDAQATHYS